MTVKAINTSDLTNLKNELKLEYQEDFKDFRHTFGGKVQEDYNKIDQKVTKYNTDVLLTNQAFINMSDKFNEIKEMMVEEFRKVNNKIDGFNDKYVTHSELAPIQEKQKSHDDIFKRFAWLSFLLLLSLIGGFIGLSKYM